MWDVWIHILGIGAECACWGAGGRKGRPYGGDEVSPRAARRVVAPYKSWNLPPHPALRAAFSLGKGFRAADSRPCREKFSGAGEDTRPCGDCGRKTAGAQCAPLRHNYKRLYIQEKGQVWNLSLKTQRRNAVSHKISLVPFFFKERNCSIPSRCPSSGPPGGRGGRPQTGCSEIRLQCARPCWDR